MDIRKASDIRVYSELPFQINLQGQHRDYVFPANKSGERSMNFIDFSDIEYANSRGNIFSVGLLVFEPEMQEEIYEALGIRDWKNRVWFYDDVIDAIEKPTLEKMQRIIDIKDNLTIERIRSQVVYYINLKKDISQKVVNIVNARYRELTTGVINSKIEIKSADVENSISSDDAEELKRQIAEQNKKIEEQNAIMLQLMEQLKANNSSSEIIEKPKEKKKPTGRPKAAKVVEDK